MSTDSTQQTFGKSKVMIDSSNSKCTKNVGGVDEDKNCGDNSKIKIHFMGGIEYRCMTHSKRTWLELALHRYIAEGQPPKDKKIAKQIDRKLHTNE